MTTLAQQVLDSAIKSPEISREILQKLHKNGETVGNILNFAEELQTRMIRIPAVNFATFDLCGTGGSGLQRINLSTALAVKLSKEFAIAKHGNKAASGKVGSFDLISSLDLPVGDTPEKVQESLENNNLAFIFAPAFHPALKPLAPIRQSLNHPTIFNYLGPILNPLENLTAQVIGVSSVEIGEKLAEVCLELKKKALIVHDLKFGLDDVSIGGETSFWEVNLNERKIFTGKISPENYGIDRVEKFSEIQGGKTPEENKDIFKDLLENKASKARQNFMEINYLVIKGFFEKIIKDN